MRSEKTKQHVVDFWLRGGFTVCGHFIEIRDGRYFQSGPYCVREKNGNIHHCASKELEITMIVEANSAKIHGKMMDFQGEKIIVPSANGKTYLDRAAVNVSDPQVFRHGYISTIVELDENDVPVRLLLPSDTDNQKYRVGAKIEFGTWMKINGHKIWFKN